MKKLNLRVGGIKEMLTKEQMKQIIGGYTAYMATCYWIVNEDCNDGKTKKNYTTTMVQPPLTNANAIDQCMAIVDTYCAGAGDCCDGDGWQ